MEIGNTWQYSGNMCRKHQEATCCTCCPMISRLKLFRTVQLKSKYKIDSWASESFLARRKSLAKDVRKISGVSNSAIISLCKILLFRKIGKNKHLLQADKDPPCVLVNVFREKANGQSWPWCPFARRQCGRERKQVLHFAEDLCAARAATTLPDEIIQHLYPV